jgi:hypothetical protein
MRMVGDPTESHLLGVLRAGHHGCGVDPTGGEDVNGSTDVTAGQGGSKRQSTKTGGHPPTARWNPRTREPGDLGTCPTRGGDGGPAQHAHARPVGESAAATTTGVTGLVDSALAGGADGPAERDTKRGVLEAGSARREEQ